MPKQKTLAKLKKELEVIVNKYIRLRDNGKPCVSCGEFKTLQAGHYYAVQGYDSLRFDPDNIHGECAGCNCFNESHLILYSKNIVGRIGQERLDALDERAADYKRNGYRWTRIEIEEKKILFKKLLKDLE